VEWYQKAADQGDEDAKKRLKTLKKQKWTVNELAWFN
jgi:TPR repeat protein